MTTSSRRSEGFFEHLSLLLTDWAGSTLALFLAAGLIAAWLLSGPLFGFSDTWQLVVNTATSTVTFLMVFLIQRSQNKQARSVQLKLSELVAALDGASNRLIDVESLSEKELEALHRHYAQLSRLSAKEGSLFDSHSVEEAERRHAEKSGGRKRRSPSGSR